MSLTNRRDDKAREDEELLSTLCKRDGAWITQRMHESQYIGWLLHRMRATDLCNQLFGDEAFPKKKKSTSKPKPQGAIRPIYRPTLDVDRSLSEVNRER